MTVKIANVQGYALTHANVAAKVSNVQGYALATPPAPLQLRDVRGYAMGVLPLSIGLRSLNGYAMVPFADLPKGTNGQTSLMNLILQKSKSVRPASQFSLGAPEVSTEPGYDSKALLTALPAAQLSGSMYWYYNRVRMSRLTNLSGIVIGAAANTHALISAINTATGMVLTTADIVNDTIPAGSVEVTLTAATTSYFFVPGSTVQLGNTPTLASLFKSDVLLFP